MQKPTTGGTAAALNAGARPRFAQRSAAAPSRAQAPPRFAAAPATAVQQRRRLSNAWRVEAAWSVSGKSTTIVLSSRAAKRRVLLDCGGTGVSCAEADVVLITHGHVDHLGGVFVHARSRQTPATYLVPAEIVPQVAAIREAFEAVDGHALAMTIVGVTPDEPVHLGKGLVVMPVRTQHRVPSVGYLLQSHRRLQRQGGALAEATSDELVTEVAYSGDCVAASLDARLLSAPLCIVEATFLGVQGNSKDGEAAAAEHAHVLLSQLEARAAQVPDVGQNLLLCHFSARYSPAVIRERCAQASFWAGRPVAMALTAFGVTGRQANRGSSDDDVVWTVRREAG